ncbi:MAG: hypothetical protein JEZ00_10940 [Anaerolineaceae bacterium]|nr:hypothetical protein [Anaerolineaceae bacterium]
MEEKKKITRRQFLVTGASILGASALCVGGARFAIQEPEIEYTNSTCGQVESKSKKVLVAYATMAGSTGEIAGEIGNTLCGSGYMADVQRIEDIRDISGYQAVVIGSAIHTNTWLPAAVDFVKTYRETLSTMPVAYFTNSITLAAQDAPEVRQQVDGFLDVVREEIPEVQPVGVEHFAGVLDLSKLPLAIRLIWPLTAGGKTKEGDYRNWDAIKGWAASLASTFA